MKRKRDHLANAALAMAIIGTASAEYQLAKDVGWGRMAFALPGALDIYVIRALRAHRDMLAAILAMFAVNAVSHLITVGKLDASVWVVIGVSGIAPAVLWRVHALREAVPAAEAEPTDLLPEGLPELTERAPEPVVIERVEEPEPHAWPLLGPMTPVAELLAATPAAPAVAPAVAPVALLSVADVAETKGVAEGTVRSWVKRDKLTPAQRDSNGRLLFHPDAVAALGATP